MIRRFVILGASGDLTARYLLPALARLFERRAIPADLHVVGVARDDWTTESFRSHAVRALETHAPEIDADAARALVSTLEWARADLSQPGQLASALRAGDATRSGSALRAGDEPFVAYLALPPRVFAPALESLAAITVPDGSRIVVEKPFGDDHASARALNELIHASFPEEAVFRVDHFLHKQTVQNVLGVRFANRVFEPVWNRGHIEQVDIVWDEMLTLEGRTYYDQVGALKDMIQNHLLQLLSLVAMEPPISLGERDLRDRKVDVLRAVRTPTLDDVRARSVRARYTAGRIGSRDVPAYADEAGIDPERGTETFATVTVSVENWRWAGVPFVLRSGKALGRDRRFIAVRFRPVPHLAFGQTQAPEQNVLRFEIAPDRLSLDVMINGEGDPFDLEGAQLDAQLAPQDVPAYGRLLLDVLEGDPALSIRDDEAEESWRIVDPIVRAWSDGVVPLLEYPAGSAGPAPA